MSRADSSLSVIGAGVGRTGTASLKAALEMLLDGPCYHMFEIANDPGDVDVWRRAALGDMPDWRRFLAGWRAAVDWPACAFWAELAAAFPTAVIVLSTRPAEDWWRSASRTIFPAARRAGNDAWRAMFETLVAQRFTAALDDRDAAIAAYEAHNAGVRAAAPPDRLVEWQPGDGWAPLCDALGCAVPAVPFPHTNTSAEFHARFGDGAT